MELTCPKCSYKPMRWVGESDIEDSETYFIMSTYDCPKCETEVNINWSEK